MTRSTIRATAIARKVKKNKENQDEIPEFYAVRCPDVALHRGFCTARRAKDRRPKVLRDSCADRGAEVLHNYQKPGGRVGRPRHCPGDAGDVRRQTMHASLRVTSRGHVLVHEFQEAGTPLDATKYDHPVTMLYVDADQLTLVHYCDAGNRPRMTGKMSPDGKTVEFEFKDISGSPEYHMHHSVFTIIDANHHTEDWPFMLKEKTIQAEPKS